MAWFEMFQMKNTYHVENIYDFLEDGVRATIVSSGNRVVWLLLFEGEIIQRH